MKQVKMWGMTLVAAMMVLGVSAQTANEVGLKMKAAGEMINGGKPVEAIPLIEEVITMGQAVGADAVDITSQAQKLLPKLYYQKGINAVKAKEMAVAIPSLEKAAMLADMQGDMMVTRQAQRLVSNIYMMQGAESFNAKDYTKALETFQKGMKQDPENIKLTYYVAKSYAELGQLEKAVEFYTQIIAAGESNSKFEKEAADAKEDMNNYMLVAASEAAKVGDVEKVQFYVAAIPTNADANMLLVQTANNLKKYDAVIAAGSAAYEAQTDDVKKSEVAYLMGVAYQNKDNNAKSAEWLRKVTTGSYTSAAKTLLVEVTKPAV